VRDGALTNRRSDGSIVENYKEFWYSMVGLAGEGSSFDGNGSAIRTGLGGGSYTANFGRSRTAGSTVIGNSNLKPLGSSPLYPSARPPYKLDAACYRQALPNVNGPQAGPSQAPPSIVSPTPAPLPPPGASTTTTATSSTATTADGASGGNANSQPLSHANPLRGTTR
jgi:hypothetical protein